MKSYSAISLQPRPLDIQMADIARRFRTAGVALPARLCCENDRAFVERITRRYPDIVAPSSGGHEPQPPMAFDSTTSSEPAEK